MACDFFVVVTARFRILYVFLLMEHNLAQLAEATGGEAYFQSFQTPVAFTPFLDQIANQLKHQYQVTFLAKAGTKASYQFVQLETEVPNAELVAADKVFVQAAH